MQSRPPAAPKKRREPRRRRRRVATSRLDEPTLKPGAGARIRERRVEATGAGKVQRNRGSTTAVRMPDRLHADLSALRSRTWPRRADRSARNSGRACDSMSRRRSASGRASAAPRLAPVLPLLPDDEERAGVEDRRVRARDDADEQRQDEVWIAAPPNRSRASSVSTTVSSVLIERPNVWRIEWLTIAVERLAGVTGPVLADPVEHHDRVVDAESDDGQHRGHEQRVDLDAEEGAEDRERSRRRRCTSWSSATSAVTPEPEVAEPEGDPDRGCRGSRRG